MVILLVGSLLTSIIFLVRNIKYKNTFKDLYYKKPAFYILQKGFREYFIHVNQIEEYTNGYSLIELVDIKIKEGGYYNFEINDIRKDFSNMIETKYLCLKEVKETEQTMRRRKLKSILKIK